MNHSPHLALVVFHLGKTLYRSTNTSRLTRNQDEPRASNLFGNDQNKNGSFGSTTRKHTYVVWEVGRFGSESCDVNRRLLRVSEARLPVCITTKTHAGRKAPWTGENAHHWILKKVTLRSCLQSTPQPADLLLDMASRKTGAV